MVGKNIYQNILRWELCILLMQYVVSKPCMSCDASSLHMPAFDDKKVADFPLATYQDVQNLLQCIETCYRNYRCRSYMFNSETGTCSTFAVGYSDPGNTYVDVLDESGDKLYAMCGKNGVFGSGCTSDGDCTFNNSKCRSSRCGCLLGYSFEPTSGHCVKYCSTYGQFFDKYVDSGIAYCFPRYSTVASADICPEMCLNETSLVCMSSDYNTATSECQLCDTAWFDHDPSDHYYPGWLYFHRHCGI